MCCGVVWCVVVLVCCVWCVVCGVSQFQVSGGLVFKVWFGPGTTLPGTALPGTAQFRFLFSLSRRKMRSSLSWVSSR